ncbi:MAG TPA: helix-turn-helix transcriptional regulator, partial [Stellaceae bacterium]|nr:helix-turn-helix transcriptional regulator [Stellaceae bacterium]
MSTTSALGGAGRRPRRTVREHGPDPVDVHVGRRLRQARLLAGLSQEELGDGIGVSFQAVQKYEQG